MRAAAAPDHLRVGRLDRTGTARSHRIPGERTAYSRRSCTAGECAWSDDERPRLAVIGQRLGRRILAHVATVVTPDTILRWHRELIARKWTSVRSRPGRPGVQAEIRRLAIRMATDNPSWGYTRIQGALKNVGHRVARSTIAKILKEQGIPPSRQRPMTWRTFLRAH